jgi:hypothetical protein
MREVGIILIASFAIDRIVAGIFFLLSYDPELRGMLDPESIKDLTGKTEALRTYRVLYTMFAAYLGTVVLAGHLGHRLSTITQVLPKTEGGWNTLLDILVTGLLLAGGADRLAEALKLTTGMGDDKKSKTPIEITGRVVLEQSGPKAGPA